MEYLGESALCILFLLGLDFVITKYVYSERTLLPNLTDAKLHRFIWFELLLLALWSLCFKAVLYSTLKHSASHRLLATSQSVPISTAAELLVIFLALVATLHFTFRPQRADVR